MSDARGPTALGRGKGDAPRHLQVPPPSQVQPPFEQSVNEHDASGWQSIVQLPPEHAKLHVEPAAHAIRQPPLEQSIVQSPPGGHATLQPPLEQSTLHGPAPQ